MPVRAFTLLIIAGFAIVGYGIIPADSSAKRLLSERVHRELSAIHELIDAERNQEALVKLNALLPTVQEHAYQTAVIYQTLGYVYNLLENYPKSIEAFKKALNTDALPEEVSRTVTFDLAQLLVHMKDYIESIHYLESWLAKEKQLGLDGHMLAATAYYQAERWEEAIPHLRKIITLQKNPEENWYRILLACYRELSQLGNAAQLLERVIEVFPAPKDYWIQLIGTYQQLKQDRRALATMELAYKRHLLDESELIQLAKMYLYLDMPYKAAQLLEFELNTGHIDETRSNRELLANCWILAQEPERAANILSRMARVAKSPEIYLRLGQLLVDLERWGEATRALQAALSSGSLKSSGIARLLLGIALYRTGHTRKSLESLQLALTDKASRSHAEWWIRRIHEEGDAREAEG